MDFKTLATLLRLRYTEHQIYWASA